MGAVIGQIDITLLAQGAPESEYLTLEEVNSVTASTNSVRQISPLPILKPDSTAVAPKVIQYLTTINEPTQIGLEFSEFMDRKTVLDNLSLTASDSNTQIEYIPVWVFKNLYLLAILSLICLQLFIVCFLFIILKRPSTLSKLIEQNLENWYL